MKSVSKSKLRRRLGLLGGALLLYTVTGFFILPPIIKSQLEKRLGAELGRRVSVEKVRLNPYALSLTLENFAIYEPDGTGVFVGWRRLYANFDALSSLRGDWVLSDIALDGFSSRVVLNADSSFNFSDILGKVPKQDQAKSTPQKPGRPLRIGSFLVSDARVDFADRSRPQPFATTLGPVTFTLTGFRTVSVAGAPYRFEAATESGERFTWSGSLQAQPLQSVGEFRLENILLSKYAPYYSDRTQADVVEGNISVGGRYELNLEPGKQVVKLIAGAVQLKGLKIVERANKESVIDLPGLVIKGINAEALTRKAAIDSVVLSGGQIRARREKDGTINLLALLRPSSAAASPTATPTVGAVAPASTPMAGTETKPDFKVGELALKDFQVEFADLAAPRPVDLKLSAIDFSLKNLTPTPGAQMPLQLAFAFGPTGTVHVEGEVGMTPLNVDLKTTVAGIAILPLSPYIEQFVNARISQGEVNATISTQALLADGEKLAASVTGDVKVEKFGMVDAVQNEELIGFGALTVQGLRASTSATQGVAVEEINVTRPYARVVVNRDHSLNLATVARTAPAAAPGAEAANTVATAPLPATAGTTAPTPAPSPKIEIGKVIITDGDYRFTDRSIEPGVSMAINQFTGTIAGLSSANPAKATVDLKGTVDGAGPISITGKFDPLGPTKSVDLKVDFKNVDLLPLSPYSGKYAGYELARGKLLLDVKVLVEGKKIDATNVITLNQFTFGGAVNSPDATGLPVRLGVALLKDMDGKIVIDVPVQGSTDDPNFRVGRVVLRVIVNLLTKAAVSPFALLGAAFGGGGDELAYQEFEAGSSTLQPGELKKLQTMTQAMKNRPGLSLSLEGSYDAAADAYALRSTKLTEKIRRTIWEEKRAKNPSIAPPAELVISPEETVAMMKKLYDEQFPPGTKFGTPVPEPPKPIAPPPKPVGFFQRIVDAITQRSKREEKAAEAENARRLAEHGKVIAAAVATGLPLEEMRGRLTETIVVDENDLRTLAQARAQQVRDYFSGAGEISPDRLFLAKDSSDAAKPGKGTRVFLSLQ